MANSKGELFNDSGKEITELKSQVYTLQNKLTKAETQLEEIRKENEDFEQLRADKTFGVAVCGDVLVNKLEVKIINTPTFQRLRKVKQLGSTFLVYPSAVHTRFEHSLGVLKAADIIIKNIRNNRHSSKEEKTIKPEEEQIIRLIALLHDIGHMPYGHTIEDEFGIYKSHDKHETRWDYFLGINSSIGAIIVKERGIDFHKRFFQLIKCEKNFTGFEQDAFMYDIVSNTVCADLLDYLNRDCFYTNLQLKYHPRFLNYFYIETINKNKNAGPDQAKEIVKEKRIAIRVYKQGKKELRRDIISELIQLLRNRYYLGERVYYHHAKIKTGTLIAGAVLRAKDAGCFDQLKIIDTELQARISQNADPSEDKKLFSIHNMGDDDLVALLLSLSEKNKNPIAVRQIKGAKNLAKAFNERIKYEELIYKTKDDLGIEDEFDTDVLSEKEPNGAKHEIAEKLLNRFINYGTARTRLEIEDNICEYLEMESGDLLIYCPNFNMAMKLAKVKIEDQKKRIHELRNFNDKSIKAECKSILDKHQALWALRVFVNPKYIDETNEEFKETYLEYKDLLLKYCDWTILAKDSDDEKVKGEVFWNAYIDHVLAKKEITGTELNLTISAKKEKMKELVADLVSNTYGTRKYSEIINKINIKFGIKLNA